MEVQVVPPPDLSPLLHRLTTASDSYRNAKPFPNVVLDDVLPMELVRQAAAEFPSPGSAEWKNYVHVNERKFGNTRVATWGQHLQAITVALTSPEFCATLDELTGFRGLLPDLSMDGGGLHQSLRGGHLNVHADFTAHHTHETWRRRVNVLLYLTEGWDPGWGGALELWERDMSRSVQAIVPTANRMVVFSTDVDSFHGHPAPMTCPEGVARRSLALYYFTDEPSPIMRSTNFRPVPGDGRGRRVAIAADRWALRIYDAVKRPLKLSDDKGMSKLLGRFERLIRRRSR
jgi:hypothetical protein